MAGEPVVLAVAISILLLLVVGYLWSALAIRSVSVSAVASGSVTKGETLELVLSVEGPAGFECAVQVMGSEPLGLRTPASGRIGVHAVHMGRFDRVGVTLQTTVPDGVVGAVESRSVLLPEPFYVYPVPIVCNIEATPNTPGYVDSDAGELSGLREYSPGDRIRDVHWPALARTGTVLVRDHRSAPVGGEVIVAVAPTEHGDIDYVAGQARFAVHTLIQRGHRVSLHIGSELLEITTEVLAYQRLASLEAALELKELQSDLPVLVIDAKRGAQWATQTRS